MVRLDKLSRGRSGQNVQLFVCTEWQLVHMDKLLSNTCGENVPWHVWINCLMIRLDKMSDGTSGQIVWTKCPVARVDKLEWNYEKKIRKFNYSHYSPKLKNFTNQKDLLQECGLSEDHDVRCGQGHTSGAVRQEIRSFVTPERSIEPGR